VDGLNGGFSAIAACPNASKHHQHSTHKDRDR
jgi:hypothetical protein